MSLFDAAAELAAVPFKAVLVVFIFPLSAFNFAAAGPVTIFTDTFATAGIFFCLISYSLTIA